MFKKRSLHQIAPLAHTDSSIISSIDKQDNLGGHRCGLRLLGASKTIDFKTEHHAGSLFEDEDGAQRSWVFKRKTILHQLLAENTRALPGSESPVQMFVDSFKRGGVLRMLRLCWFNFMGIYFL